MWIQVDFRFLALSSVCHSDITLRRVCGKEEKSVLYINHDIREAQLGISKAP